MADYTALAIGINRYQYIQPLNYAQDDAQAIYQLLVEETELPPEQALLLTDASPWVGNQTTEPTKETIGHWIDTWLATQSGTLLWFFFSGYGVSWQGVDYLMPIDGNPADIPGTGIPVEDLLKRLQGQGDRRVLALLDINRSPGVIAGEPVGAQLAQLAPEMGVSLLLSSQIEESSHEAVALGHGMFTAALLEALRYFGSQTTLDNISSYLYERLPELSEHHWRPVQHPLIIIPSIEFAQAPLLPQGRGEAVATAPPLAAVAAPMVPENGTATAEAEEFPPELAAEPLGAPPEEDEVEVTEPTRSLDLPPFSPPPPASMLNPPTTSPNVPPAAPSSPARPSKSQQSWLIWGGGLLLILGLLGLLNWMFGDRTPAPDTATDPATEAPITPVPAGDPASPAAPDPNAATPPAEVPPTDAPAQAPTAAPTTDAAAVPTTLEESQAILARARTYIQSNQASGFSRAIAEANRIPPGAPLYTEAQADINRWSQVILDIAKGRANQGQFDAAIAAAQLIPASQTQSHAAAQQNISQWTQNAALQTQNSEKIRAARRMIRYTQASSYIQGINELKTIPAGQPGYQQAQDLIKRWGEQIYLIANSRAARGEFEQAIATAQLVPADAPNYQAAQSAIARWQKGQR
ncbi:caspase family protein [Spirulina major CS-329]|uniref:caspase family protein n=1 Tax=Spirulina TaxID=1154 RepID=UPI00232EFE2E|nr:MULTISPECIES: caspase family protein [Spirulina]MDB9493933.1 caspase family protein [Spirulina subsalsa CS-330]MDB9503692.1 caspase family protein [Spirulina major CS-329]